MGNFDFLRFVDLIMVVGVLVGSLAVGIATTRANKDTEGFFLAGRAMPGWAVGLSLMATIVSAMTFLAVPAFAYAADWRWMAVCLAYPVAIIPSVKWFMPFFRRSRVRSAYEYLEQRFGAWARIYVGGGFVLIQWLRMGIILYAASLALKATLGIDVPLIIVGIGTVVVAYCTLGGLRAVIWTDVIQGIGLMLGAILVLPIVLWKLPGGASQLIDEVIASGKTSLGPMSLEPTSLTFWAILMSHIVIFTQWACTDQMIVQRYCAPRDEKEARKTQYISVMTAVPIWLCFTVLGTVLWVFYQHTSDPAIVGMTPEEVFPHFISTQMPPGLRGFVIAAVCMAAMSTLSASINAAAGVLETDFYRRFLVRNAAERHYLVVGRILSVLFGGAVMVVALLIHAIRTATLQELHAVVVGILGSGLLGLFLLGFATHVSNGAAAIATGVTIAVVTAWLVLTQFETVAIRMPHALWLGVAANLILFLLGLALNLLPRRFGRLRALGPSESSQPGSEASV